jgi:hypothetical protein
MEWLELKLDFKENWELGRVVGDGPLLGGEGGWLKCAMLSKGVSVVVIGVTWKAVILDNGSMGV